MIAQRYEALEENAASNGICLGQPLVLRDDNAEEVFCVGVQTKCQPDKMPTGHNANQMLAFC